jgi:sorting nexin-25
MFTRFLSLSDLGANMIGRSNARRGARRLFAVLQNRRLNQHLLYTIVDEVGDSLSLTILSICYL